MDMRNHSTYSQGLAVTMRGTRYTLARQLAAKYFRCSPLEGTYAVLDVINATLDRQITIPLTVNNGL